MSDKVLSKAIAFNLIRNILKDLQGVTSIMEDIANLVANTEPEVYLESISGIHDAIVSIILLFADEDKINTDIIMNYYIGNKDIDDFKDLDSFIKILEYKK